MSKYGAVRTGGKGAERRGPYSGGKGKGKGDRAEDEEERMVYVANLPFSAEWQELKDFFAAAGEVEFARVLSKDGSTVQTKGKSRGIGYVRFSTQEEAETAIATLDGTEMDGRVIKVDTWTAPAKGEGGAPPLRSRSTSAGRPAKGKGKLSSLAVYTPPRPTVYTPPLRSSSVGKGGGGKGKGKGQGPSEEEAEQTVYVANLPFSAEWQELKDHFSQCGTVEYARVLTKDGGSSVSTKGRSRGVGYVRFSTIEEAQAAIDTLNGSELDGRELVVDVWESGPPAGGQKGGKKGGKKR